MPDLNLLDLDQLAAAIGLELDPARRAVVVAAFAEIAKEIAKLRSLDLTDVHPAVVFSPLGRRG
jgi:Protein of unknown function (DUF4089)